MVQDFASDHASSPDRAQRKVRPRDPQAAAFIAGFSRFLVEGNYVEQAGIDRAAQAQKQTKQRFDLVLTQLGLLSEAALLKALADYCDIDILQPASFPVAPVLEDLLDADFVKRNRLLPISIADQEVTVASADPFNSDTIAAISYLTSRTVRATLALGRDIDAAITRLYDAETQSGTDPDGLGNSKIIYVNDDDIQRLHDIASEAPVIRLVNRLISAAAEQRASDIHFEPLASDVRVRFRIDGTMSEVERLSADLLAGIASRIKILSKLNIAERRLPQDGRCKFVVAGREIDLRISTMPMLHGEAVVIRLLDSDVVDLSFGALGFNRRTQAAFEKLLGVPNGIILVTGPTGSGKTTTLYTALKQLNSVERKVFTVEDPIEYQLAGVNQIQIKPAIGLDFVHCLRSILRQDPDIIMVGEMRDVETAKIGIQAALTGHLVLSTLHTNSAASAVTRLLDMGVEDFLLASSLTGVIAQRLVRKLCPDCAAQDLSKSAPISQLLQELPNPVPAKDAVTLKRPVGCGKCRNSGYRGRTSIVETLVIDDSVREKIRRGTSDRDIEKVGLANGMETLYQNALRKAFSGETSLAEVFKVARV